VRDGIALAASGHPTIVFVHDAFDKAARTLARTLGAEDLRIYAYPQPVDADSDRANAGTAAQKIAGLLNP